VLKFRESWPKGGKFGLFIDIIVVGTFYLTVIPMYTEGFDEFDGFKDTERSTRRAYVSSVSQEDADRLMHENEQLKKALEKEQFFNKLLDQEIQELKSQNGQREAQVSDYWYGNRGVSKGAFYSLLFVALAMAGYIGYGLYYDKQFDYYKEVSSSGKVVSDEAAPGFSTPSGNNQSNMSGEAQPAADEAINNTTPVATTPTETEGTSKPAVKDSVPNIIAKDPVETDRSPREQERVAVNTPPREIDVEKQVTNSPNAAVDTRPVIARYRVSSKANFYSSADENTMRGVFISQGDDKIVGALEDRNGFIYVVYTNDLGYTSKGWLSKKDLTKVD
jgi:eukaryotic-like serine/threonine-protein kinase